MRITKGRIGPGSLLAVAALGSAGCAVSSVTASGGHGQKVPCGPVRAQTVAADGGARVYGVPAGHVGQSTLYNYDGCTVGNAKSRLLASSVFSGPSLYLTEGPFSCAGNHCTWVRGIRLAGAKVGIIAESYGLDAANTTLTVRNLANGQVLHTVQTYSISPGNGVEVMRYVLAPSGNIAWATGGIVPSGNIARATNGIIRRAIERRVSTLDAGPKVRASSLRLQGDTVEWIDGGKRRTASLR